MKRITAAVITATALILTGANAANADPLVPTNDLCPGTIVNGVCYVDGQPWRSRVGSTPTRGY